MARAQTMWKEWRQERMWQPSVAPLRLHALHLIMRPRLTASSTFSSPPVSLTHTCHRPRRRHTSHSMTLTGWLVVSHSAASRGRAGWLHSIQTPESADECLLLSNRPGLASRSSYKL